MIKRLPTMWETRVQSLCWEDLLEKEIATHSSILAWKMPWTEELGRLQSMGSQSRTRLSDLTSLYFWINSISALVFLVFFLLIALDIFGSNFFSNLLR